MNNETVNHPKHYTRGDLEVIDIIDAFTESLSGAEAFCAGNVLKYICRWPYKNGLEDLKKAQWYLSRLINMRENKEEERPC